MESSLALKDMWGGLGVLEGRAGDIFRTLDSISCKTGRTGYERSDVHVAPHVVVVGPGCVRFSRYSWVFVHRAWD